MTDAGGAARYYVVQVSTAPTAPGRRITNHLAVSAPILARIGSDSLKMSAATSDELYFFTDKPTKISRIVKPKSNGMCRDKNGMCRDARTPAASRVHARLLCRCATCNVQWQII